MLQTPRAESAIGQIVPAHPGCLIFIGSRLVFSDWILRVASEETGDMPVHRMEKPDPARLRELTGREGLRVAFIDESFVDELLVRLDASDRAFSKLRWVLAYRTPASARRIFALRESRPSVRSLFFLPMNAPIDSWVPMLKLILAGDFFVTGDLACDLCTADPREASALRDAGAEDGPALTPRERQVLALVAEGKRNKCIAFALEVSEHTVKLHLHNAIAKIGVRNRTEAAAWYLTSGVASHG